MATREVTTCDSCGETVTSYYKVVQDKRDDRDNSDICHNCLRSLIDLLPTSASVTQLGIIKRGTWTYED